MRKVALIILLTATAQYCTAQPLKAEEMLEMIECNDYNCISGKVEPLGYDVAFNKEVDGYQLYTFTSKTTYQNESNAKITRPYEVKYTIRTDDRAITLNYVVGDKTTREQLLAEFEHQGFIYMQATKTKSNYDNTATVYESEQYPDLVLKVTNYQKKELRHTYYMDYDFELWRSTGKKAEKK